MFRRRIGKYGFRTYGAAGVAVPPGTVVVGLPTDTNTALATSIGLGVGLPSDTNTALIPTAFVVGTDIPAVIYDGVGDYLLHTGGPTGASDGTTGTFVWSGTFNSDGSAMTLFDIPGTVPVLLERQSDNTIDFVVGTSGAVCSASTTAVAASLGFLIVLASFTGTTANLYVIHAAGTITGTPSAGSGASADLTADWYLGSDGGAANFLDADTALWWADDGYIDFSDSNNREEFWDTTNDLLRNPGSDGSNPSGAQPLVCHKNSSSTHTVNAGSGGDADGGSNSGDGTSPGAYADDYSPSSGITLVGTSTPVFETDAADRLLTLTYPSGIQADDVILLHLVSDWGDGWTVTGYTYLENADSNPFHAVRHQVWGKVASGSESGTFDATFASGVVSVMGGSVTVWRGVDVSGGIGSGDSTDGVRDGVAAVDNNSAGTPGTTATASTVTTNTNGAAVLRFEANDGNQNSGSGPATEVYFDGTALGNDIGMGLSYAIQATAGAAGTVDFTLDSADDWVTTTFTLKPA